MRRFLMGFATAWSVDKLAWTLVLSDTEMGRSILARWLGRLSHDRFLAFNEAIVVEARRRSKSLD